MQIYVSLHKYLTGPNPALAAVYGQAALLHVHYLLRVSETPGRCPLDRLEVKRKSESLLERLTQKIGCARSHRDINPGNSGTG
jgi:hypothetical protein